MLTDSMMEAAMWYWLAAPVCAPSVDGVSAILWSAMAWATLRTSTLRGARRLVVAMDASCSGTVVPRPPLREAVGTAATGWFARRATMGIPLTMRTLGRVGWVRVKAALGIARRVFLGRLAAMLDASCRFTTAPMPPAVAAVGAVEPGWFVRQVTARSSGQ